MAGDWIKMRVGLTYDLKLMQIARILNGDSLFLNQLAPNCQIPQGGCNAQALHTYVIGALHRFWCAAQEVSQDGKLGTLEAHDIDFLVGCKGFCDCLVKVGWLEVSEDGRLQVHNWFEHNGESAKKRALGQKRVKKHREAGKECNAPALPPCNAPTLPEKRREEKSKGIKDRAATKKPFQPPSLEEVKAYCLERGNSIDPQRFIDSYTSKGWMVGKNKMQDWQAAIRTWEKNQFNDTPSGQKAGLFDGLRQFASRGDADGTS
jgi:hypothetical protein